MKRVFMSVAVGSLLCIGAASVSAQGSMPASMGPPKVMSIDREVVKFGKGSAHEKNEAMYARAARDGKEPGTYIAMTSTTGPEEAWFLEGYESFDAMEKQQNYADQHASLQAKYDQIMEQDSQFVSEAGHMVGMLNQESSFHDSVDISKMRYMEVETIRWRAGHDKEWAEMVKMFLGAAEKSKVDWHMAFYDVTYGAPQGTVIIFTPHTSLAEIDSEQGKELQVPDGRDGSLTGKNAFKS